MPRSKRIGVGKWLAAGGILIVVLLLWLWRDMEPSEPQKPAPVLPHATAVAMVPASDSLPAAPKPIAVAATVTAPVAEVAEAKPAKLDPRTDEFFYRFDETIPKIVTRNAAKCYEGRHGSLHRNQKLSLRYKVKVVSGEVQVRDVSIKESTLNDAALETCFIQQVQRSTWNDDQLPDVEIEDEIVLRPERGMKKYWQDNMDYVGAEAPRQ
ncbi:MAG TPA: hypothetical protein VHN14_26165 [Kofleriaceae bacterium]|jgi:hypothetical protein|nr:hypothetical protein [Kofleriaceae bacterium]